MGKTILLTGRPRAGKTTVLKEVIEELPGKGGGFYTAEIRRGGRRQGFKIITLGGREGTLAHVNIKGAPRVSKYGVNMEDLEKVGVTAIWQAIRERDYVVIDEIGKMELFSPAFKEATLAAIESDKMVIGTITMSSHPWADRLKALPQVEIIQVTRANRSSMAQQILDLLSTGRAS